MRPSVKRLAMVMFIEYLQRTTILAFSITSWWRTAEHNAALGGVPSSKHLHGEALDVVWDGEVQVWPAVHELNAAASLYGCRVIREGIAVAHSTGPHDHVEAL